MKRREMGVSEAGRKGGTTTRDRYGWEHYSRIGKKGGARVAELVKAGKEALKINETRFGRR